MTDTNRKPTFNVDAIMTNAHDGYRQDTIDKAKIHRLNCMLDEAYKVRKRLRNQIIDLEAELATVQTQRLADRHRFITILTITFFVMTLMLITAVMF